ncbi:probable tubulin polyglutamylase TTLL9 isoform X2 [Xenia sp. Carnegie-2017]|uniref:probable tubulin polyglutamylase TTLL9 isoform X2 n=1 Tax=Xenia sp. Carnegie-2017 TaxID=2897299 RepID=UPI001F035B8D|nr:probable tubulin polyglutamylase TTLL9 isoform X2 [Xenia sp. Carnegie-2017]
MAKREAFQPKARDRQSSWKQAQRKPFDNSRTIRFKCSLQNTIIDVLRSKGWEEVKEGENDWDIFWCDVGWMRENFDHSYLQEHVKLCHFRNHYELTRKNLMVKNLKRLRKKIERERGKEAATKCDFYPTTYQLPAEYHIFVEEFKKNPGSIWIMKPVAKSQGKGIFLFKKLRDIIEWRKEDYFKVTDEKNDGKEAPETYIVQRYVENPYLIGGRKFDIRVYVLVTNYVPLSVWLYRDGFARFSNTRFSLESIDDTYIHLTNVAIQKTAPDYDPEKGCKWSPLRLRKYLTAKHGIEKVEKLFRLIDEIIITSLQAVQKIMINDKHCFELYGYDILVDENLKPLTGKEKRVGNFDLVWHNGPIMADNLPDTACHSSSTHPTNSFLGCLNDREKQLAKLYKEKPNDVKDSPIF